MFPKRIFIILLMLALVSMACSININLPVEKIKTGDLVEEDIVVPAPDSSDQLRLTLNFGAGEMNLTPGDESTLVSGTALYNVKTLKPSIEENDNEVVIKTGENELKGLPSFGDEFKNEWNLKLGSAPMDLVLNCGAYKGNFELGGLNLKSVRVSDGASDVTLEFSQPNLTEMETFRYETGASSVELLGLANANFDNMVFKSGAGSYTLDFSGELQRDATVTIDTGFSSIKVIVPEGVSARVFVDGGFSNVDVGGAWEKSGNDYTQDGTGPRLTINVNIGAGSLELSNR